MRGALSGGRRVAAVGLVALLVFVIGGAANAVPFNEADFSGYATGNIAHVDVAETAPDAAKLADVEEAFTGAAVNSKGLTEIQNEMNRIVSPADASKRTYGRGSGLELGLNVDPATANQLELQRADAAAPPNSGPVMEEVIGLPVNPIAYASLLRGAAEANWSNSSTCVLGRDLSNGLGYAADAQLINMGEQNEDGTFQAPLLAADRPGDPANRVAESFSHEFLAVQQDKNGAPLGLKFGLMSEVRMTIAPVTLFSGTPNETTIEFLGEWVLRAAAGGVPGSSHIFYGPGDADLETPILSIIQAGVPDRILTFQQILGPEGLDIPVGDVASIHVGENPRAIDGATDTEPTIAANGTSASAAVDVVRVELLGGSLLDLRIGHMEVSSTVPVGGIDCGVPVSKSASPRGVTVNQSFVVSIKIDNPFGCDMTSVKVVDSITTRGGARFQVVGTSPTANQVPAGSNLASGTITWNDVGPIPKGGTKTVTTTIRAQGGGGIIEDIATATAVLGNCEGEGDGSQLVGTSLPLQVPVVLGGPLPRTGVGTTTGTALVALGLLSLAAVGLRSIRRTA
jgi:hypothetical protein